MKIKKSITFITPTLNKTGAEIVLANYIQFLSKSYFAVIISKFKGVLFENIPNTIKKIYVIKKMPTRSYLSRANYRLHIWFSLNRILKKNVNSNWYINTIMLPYELFFAEKNHVKTILHAHELEHMYASLSESEILRIVNYPILIIANSVATAEVLKKYGRKNAIEICYPAIDTNFINNLTNKNKAEFRKKLMIDEASFLWVMSGSLDSNKNPSLFIDIAVEFLNSNPLTKFMWIGGTNDSEFEKICKEKAKQMGVAQNIIWLGDAGSDYYNYFNCADGFVLTSIKESFSIVTLEAMLLKLPIVAQNCIGVKEVLGEDVGEIIEEINNPKLMVLAMKGFMNKTLEVDGKAQIKRAKSFDIAIWGAKWNSILENYFIDL